MREENNEDKEIHFLLNTEELIDVQKTLSVLCQS